MSFGRILLGILVVSCLIPGSVVQSAESPAWFDDLEQAFRVAREKRQPLFLYFTATESTACREFERNHLARADVRSLLNNFVQVRIYPEWNESLAEQYGVFRVPLVVLISAEGRRLGQIQPPFDHAGIVRLLREHGTGTATTTGSAESQQRDATFRRPLQVGAPSVARAGEDFPVQVRAANVEQVVLHFLEQEQGQYRTLLMSFSPGDPILWQGAIPGRFIRRPYVDFFVTARSGEVFLSAPENPEQAPFRILVE